MGFINLFSNLPKKSTTHVWLSNSVAIKNGNKAGTTEFAHKSKPFLVADKFSFEKITKQMVKITNIAGNMFFLIEKNKKCGFVFKIYLPILGYC